MGAGASVIGGNDGGTPELINDGENGFVVDPEDDDTLADKILLLANDKELREQLRNAGRASLDRFPAAAMIEQTLAVYQAQWL